MRTLIATVLAVAAVAPVVVTEAATGVGTTTAQLNGTVDPEGEATTYFFEYGTTEDYGLTTSPESAGAGTEPVDVEADVTGLTGNTTYHFRLVAIGTSSGTVRGADRTFKTAPNPSPPAVSSQRARDVGVSAARLTASVDPNGSATTFHFEYGTTTRYGTVTPDQSAGSGGSSVPVSTSISGLAPRTTYHYRLVATNAAGTTRGRDRTFTTARLPTGLTLLLSPRRVTWGRSLTLGGRVSGTGVSRLPLSLQAQPFPFAADFAEIARTNTGSDGGYLFQVANLWENTRYRVVTRTQVVAVSPVVEAASAVLVGARVRHVSWRRARIQGSVLPGVAGQARLQRRFRGRWRNVARKTIAPEDSVRSRYRFRVRRQRKARRYRVVVRPDDGGAHVSGASRSRVVRARRRR
jgi:hypothetical protein